MPQGEILRRFAPQDDNSGCSTKKKGGTPPGRCRHYVDSNGDGVQVLSARFGRHFDREQRGRVRPSWPRRGTSVDMRLLGGRLAARVNGRRARHCPTVPLFCGTIPTGQPPGATWPPAPTRSRARQHFWSLSVLRHGSGQEWPRRQPRGRPRAALQDDPVGPITRAARPLGWGCPAVSPEWGQVAARANRAAPTNGCVAYRGCVAFCQTPQCVLATWGHVW